VAAELGLEVQREMAGGERFVQRTLNVQRARRGFIHALFEEAIGAAARALGFIHGRIGMF
jgi:hypothetical protein